MSDSDCNLIILLFIVVIVCCIYNNKKKNNKNNKNIQINQKGRKNRNKSKHNHKIKYMEHMTSDLNNPLVPPTLSNINGEFVNIQYHRDYGDCVTAINDITTQKELFNLGFLPVRVSVPDKDQTSQLVSLFIKKINKDIKKNVPDFLHTNSGWNDMVERPTIKSGFDKQMEFLGLPGSVYDKQALKSSIRLVKIEKTEKYTTDHQIRFIIHCILQKRNVSDQIVLKLHFFMEKDKVSDCSEFFTKDLNTNPSDSPVIIEQVFIVGFLTQEDGKKTKMNKFHDYGNVHNDDGTMNQEEILKIITRKHKERENEVNAFRTSLDTETQEMHK